MYEIVDDTYCYPGTTILKNKLDIRHQKRLQAFETEMTSQRAMEPLPSGEFSAKHYYAIHKHLFQDVYAWAGKPRTLRMSKGGNPFCFPEHI
ncbi:MAG: Fic/DOC family protein, partial [Pseudorhodoplanes sp.]